MTGTVTLTFDVTGMHCASCGLLVDDVLEDLVGVHRSQTDSRRGRTVVVTEPSTATSEIVAAIAEAGYHAELASAPQDHPIA